MRYLNGWHPFESIRFDLVKNFYVAMPSSSDLGATKTASTKTKSKSIIIIINRIYRARFHHNISIKINYYSIVKNVS